MCQQLFQSPRAIERHQSGPLLAERLDSLAHCTAPGRTNSSLRLIAQHLLVFVDYLPLTADGEIGIEQIQAAADRWVSRPSPPPPVTDYHYGRMRFISDARQWLHFLGRLRQPDVLQRPYTHRIEAYADSMTQERGLSPHTMRSRWWVLEQCLGHCWQQQRPWHPIGSAAIDAAIARKGPQDGYARTSRQA